ncbi:MAG: hypothetical protein UHK44_07715 [Bacteroidaceae bacterium]|nr:hypothetical protein [Bacteroidaceae bacterium]
MQSDRFQGNVSNKLLDNFNLNEALTTLGNTASSIWGKQKVENTTIIQQAPKPKEDDNTMLYLGIGGAALLVILLIVFLR